SRSTGSSCYRSIRAGRCWGVAALASCSRWIRCRWPTRIVKQSRKQINSDATHVLSLPIAPPMIVVSRACASLRIPFSQGRHKAAGAVSMNGSSNNRRRGGAFSLIELVIVVVIIGIIAAIAIPRLSRGAAGAADNALAGDMAVWRNSLDLYQTEHQGQYPTNNTTILNQLTQYTDSSGATSATQ